MRKLFSVLTVIFVVAFAGKIFADVVINEIMYNPQESGTDSTEFIELYNTGATDVDISGWYFTQGIVDTIPAGTTLPAGGFFVVCGNLNAMTAFYGISSNIQQWFSGGLSNGGEDITIKDASGVTVDSVNYDDYDPWPTSPDGNGPSLELTDPSLDNNLATSWAASAANSIGTPGALNTQYFDNASVTITIDMSIQAKKGDFDTDTDVVHCVGSLTTPAWAPGKTFPMTNNGDSTYTVVYRVKKNTDYEFKFVINDGTWESVANRPLNVTGDTVLDTFFFNDESSYVAPVNLTLSVNMAVQIAEGNFNPTTDVVRCAGAFQGWNPGAAPDMVNADINVDSIYTVTYQVTPNTTYEYKYVIGTDWGVQETNNRSVTVSDADLILPTVWYNDDSVVTIHADGNIKFIVNMDVMAEVGIFNPAADSVHVRGDFNGWNSDDAARSHLEQNFSNPLNWFLNVPFVQYGVGDPIFYKFYVQLANNVVNGVTWADGWERPTGTGGGNREAHFEGSPTQELNAVYYDGVDPEWVIPTGKNLQVTFNVDMTPAADPTLQAIPFDATQDTLYWICEEPAFVVTQGWEDSDNMKVLQLTDADGDMIYSGTLTVAEPSWNAFVYRYGYIHAADGSWQLEPAGFSDFAYRVRYAGQDAARSFPTNPWEMPMDTWTNQEIKSDQESDPYTSYTAIGDEPQTLPKAYALNQNYPNPFNPSTTINFALVKAGKVNLSVYNVLGQKVATLLNNELATAGTHAVKWNGLDDTGNKVASGVYFYKLEAGNFTSVKKMILMK